MNKILLKRGRHEDIPILNTGEPAFTTDTKELFIGSDDGNVKISKAKIWEVGSEATMLALAAEKGDMAIRTDLNTVFLLKNDSATLATSWMEFSNTKPNGSDSLFLENKINPVYMDNLFITDVFVVATQTAMLELTAQRGDFAVRTDIEKTFVLKQSPATTLANWTELQTTSDVISVNGKTGAVTIEVSDISGLQNQIDAKLEVTTHESDLEDKLSKEGGTMTGPIDMGGQYLSNTYSVGNHNHYIEFDSSEIKLVVNGANAMEFYPNFNAPGSDYLRIDAVVTDFSDGSITKAVIDGGTW